MNGHEQVGVHTGRGAQVVAVVAALENGNVYGNVTHVAQGGVGSKRTVHADQKTLANGRTGHAAVDQLQRKAFVLQYRKRGQRRKVLYLLVKKAFFQAGDKSGFDHDHVTSVNL